VGEVSDRLLLDTTGTKQDVPQRQRCISAIFFDTIHRQRVTPFSNTQVNHEVFVEHWCKKKYR